MPHPVYNQNFYYGLLYYVNRYVFLLGNLTKTLTCCTHVYTFNILYSYPPRINSRKLKPSSSLHWSTISCMQSINRCYNLWIHIQTNKVCIKYALCIIKLLQKASIQKHADTKIPLSKSSLKDIKITLQLYCSIGIAILSYRQLTQLTE